MFTSKRALRIVPPGFDSVDSSPETAKNRDSAARQPNAVFIVLALIRDRSLSKESGSAQASASFPRWHNPLPKGAGETNFQACHRHWSLRKICGLGNHTQCSWTALKGCSWEQPGNGTFPLATSHPWVSGAAPPGSMPVLTRSQPTVGRRSTDSRLTVGEWAFARNPSVPSQEWNRASFSWWSWPKHQTPRYLGQNLF